MKSFVIFGFAVLFALFAVIYIWQRHLIYFPLKEKPSRSYYQGLEYESITLKTTDNLQLLSWYKGAKKNHPTILYIHGNAGHIGMRTQLVRPYLENGIGVFLLEYRGYGGNPGQPSEAGLYKDGRAAIQFLTNEGVSSRELILYGESLGTAVAIQLATEYPVCGLILQSPFTSLSELAKYHYPWALLRPWDRYESINKISRIHTPVLIIHGKQDQIVAFKYGQAVYDKANQPKQLLTFDRGGHNNLSSQPQFYHQVIHFIANACPAAS